jgi:hypothetical protein
MGATREPLDNRGLLALSPYWAWLISGSCELTRRAATPTKRVPCYREFLALCKDADPDIPILKQAKAEYAKLQ